MAHKGMGGRGSDEGAHNRSDRTSRMARTVKSLSVALVLGSSLVGANASVHAAPPRQAFDASGVNVTPYRGGKPAAASYTWDDGFDASEIGPIAGMFDAVELPATFYVIAGRIDASGWEDIADVLARGHEIGNHSMNHLNLVDPALSDDELTFEIEGAQQLIEQRLGRKPLTFAFPFHLFDERSFAVALRSHVATRQSFAGPMFVPFYISSSTSTEDLNGALMDGINSGGWFVSMGHSVDGLGWEPLDSAVLANHLDFIKKHSERVWVDTFENVALYVTARDHVTLQTSDMSSRRLSITLSPALAPPFSEVPLTIEVPLLDRRSSVRAYSSNGEQLSVIAGGNFVLFEMLPGETVSLIAE